MNRRQRPTHHHRHRNKVTMTQQASSSASQQQHQQNGLFKRHHCRVPLLMIVFIITIELLLLTNVSHCASKTFYMHWNTTNSL